MVPAGGGGSADLSAGIVRSGGSFLAFFPFSTVINERADRAATVRIRRWPVADGGGDVPTLFNIPSCNPNFDRADDLAPRFATTSVGRDVATGLVSPSPDSHHCESS
jgi:hypothetical protein